MPGKPAGSPVGALSLDKIKLRVMEQNVRRMTVCFAEPGEEALKLDNLEKFTGKGGVYQQYRPDYAAEALRYLHETLGIGAGACVADIGSGTGIFTRQLLLLGARAVSYTHLRAHETPEHLVCRLLLEQKSKYLKILTSDNAPHTTTLQ